MELLSVSQPLFNENLEKKRKTIDEDNLKMNFYSYCLPFKMGLIKLINEILKIELQAL